MAWRYVTGLLTAAVIMLPLACAKEGETGHLMAVDKTDPEDGAFDANNIITRAQLEDASISTELLKALLTYRRNVNVDKKLKNPYLRDSFLSIYYSNGLSAFEALQNAADQYKVSPLVLLARAQIAQGLVSMDAYPIEDPSRVEYVFGCGCAGPGACDPNFAGFDRQVDCLARQYRIILNDMDANGGATAGGWKQGVLAKSIDGQSVTPKDPGTAVAYQYDPRVGDNENGNHLFWTIISLYQRSIGYTGPSGGGEAEQRSVGNPCASSEQCAAVQQAVCIRSYPGGMCSKKCTTDAECPSQEEQKSYCIPTGDGSYCFARCDQSTGASCRNGDSAWSCCNVATTTPKVSQAICKPLDPGAAQCTR